MAKRCPPGVICIEMFSIVILLIILGFMIYLQNTTNKTNNTENIYNYKFPTQTAPVEKKQSLISMPVNVPTQRTGSTFTQVGILTKNRNDKNIILPLMGRILMHGRNTWQYYCMSEQNNATRLPVSFNGKSCMNEYGCDELNNGDNVYIQGYNDTFDVTLYEKNNYTYNSYL